MIVLHGKLDPRYSQSRGGRQRTYKQCIKDAMVNFGVTMVQCMTMAQKDWEYIIEGTGMETAAQQWEARPKASKPIDIEWRAKLKRGLGQREARTPHEAAAEEDQADMNAEEESDRSSTSESALEDEAVQFQQGQEGTEYAAATEDLTPWDEDTGTDVMDTRAVEHRLIARSHGRYMRVKVRNQDVLAVVPVPDITAAARHDSHQFAGEPMDAAEAVIDQQRSEDLGGKRVTVDEMQDSGVPKRKVKLDARHRRRNNKRVREEVNTAPIGRYEIQRGLHLIVGSEDYTYANKRQRCVMGTPWITWSDRQKKERYTRSRCMGRTPHDLGGRCPRCSQRQDGGGQGTRRSRRRGTRNKTQPEEGDKKE